MKFVKSTLQSYYFSHIDRHGNEVAHAEIIFFIIGLNGISIVFFLFCVRELGFGKDLVSWPNGCRTPLKQGWKIKNKVLNNYFFGMNKSHKTMFFLHILKFSF